MLGVAAGEIDEEAAEKWIGLQSRVRDQQVHPNSMRVRNGAIAPRQESSFEGLMHPVHRRGSRLRLGS